MKDEQLAGLERLAKYQERTDSKIVPLTAEIVLQFVADYRSLRQRAEAAEAELAAIPYRQLYDAWHSGDDGYIIRDAEDVAVWLAQWKLKQPA